MKPKNNKQKHIETTKNILKDHSSKYISFHNLRHKTQLKTGQLAQAIGTLKKQGTLKRRSKSTWEIQL